MDTITPTFLFDNVPNGIGALIAYFLWNLQKEMGEVKNALKDLNGRFSSWVAQSRPKKS